MPWRASGSRDTSSRILVLDVAALAHPAPTPSLPSETREALDVAILMLERLEHARNPFAWLVRALCCLLLNDAGRPQSR